MIFWKDFILDDVFGPLLKMGESEHPKQSEIPQCPGVMEDAYQETGQDVRPARMVGQTSLDFNKSSMDAGQGNFFSQLRRRER